MRSGYRFCLVAGRVGALLSRSLASIVSVQFVLGLSSRVVAEERLELLRRSQLGAGADRSPLESVDGRGKIVVEGLEDARVVRRRLRRELKHERTRRRGRSPLPPLCHLPDRLHKAHLVPSLETRDC